MIDPVVRAASAADHGQLDELEREARAALEGRRGADRWLATHPANAGGWDRAGVVTFVADLDGVAVGYLVLDVGEPSVARVESVYVAAAARELGFGDELLDTARREAIRLGATWLEGEALPGDRDTKNLYERAGITARLLTVSTRLDD